MGAKKLLDAVTSTGEGGERPLRQDVASHTYQVNTTGDPSAGVVDLEGSLDGVNWLQLDRMTIDAGEITADTAIRHVIEKVVNNVRLNLITLTAGTAPTVTGFYAGDDLLPKKISRQGTF